MTYILLALGGIVGALCRYHGVRLIQAHIPIAFPLGTFLVNLSGSFSLGLLGGLAAHHPTWPLASLSLLIGTGFCGAYTTFSTFAFETMQLWQQAQYRSACFNLVS